MDKLKQNGTLKWNFALGLLHGIFFNGGMAFSCGSGHYAIPAAQVVGQKGMVIALDKNREPLRELRREAESKGLSNIRLESVPEKSILNIPDRMFNVILAYDVLHYFERRQRLLSEFHRVLKDTGFLSVYPKHHKDDYPLSNLADQSLDGVNVEIERSGFILKKKFREELIHDDNYNWGTILNFIKKERQNNE